MKDSRRVAVLSFLISFIFHLSLFLLLFYFFSFKKPVKNLLKRGPEIVDIITLPPQNKVKKEKKKHKIAANVSRKAVSKTYSKKEKIPFGLNKKKKIRITASKTHSPTLMSKNKKSKRKLGKKKSFSYNNGRNARKRRKIAIEHKNVKPIKIKGGLFSKTFSTRPGFLSGKVRQYSSRSAKKEATVSIGTQSIKYASYMQHIKHKIQNVWIYPQEAIQTGQQGRLLILFSIGKDGSLVRLKLIHSSGYPLLDKAALQAVKDAAPFPPLPKRFGVDVLNIYATFEYILGNYFIY